MEVSDDKKLKAFEAEDAKLKKPVADYTPKPKKDSLWFGMDMNIKKFL